MLITGEYKGYRYNSFNSREPTGLEEFKKPHNIYFGVKRSVDVLRHIEYGQFTNIKERKVFSLSFMLVTY